MASSRARIVRDADRRMLAARSAPWPGRRSASCGTGCTGRGSRTPGESLTAALERVRDEIEYLHGVAVETVEVGDCPVDERLVALVLSSREALANAARHSGASAVSAYLEVEPHQVTVFVRDRGKGFDPEEVPRHRRGIADSIVGRMDRHGGKAVVHSEPGSGTEVELVMPR